MKKIILLIIVAVVSLSSCTDSTESLVENTETNAELTFLIDKDDIEEPDDRNE